MPVKRREPERGEAGLEMANQGRPKTWTNNPRNTRIFLNDLLLIANYVYKIKGRRRFVIND